MRAVSHSWPTGVTAMAVASASRPATQHQEDVARPDPAGVEQVDGRRVDEQVPHLEPGEVGAGEPGVLAVQDLLEARVQAHADDQPGLLGRQQQQGGVLGWWRRTPVATGGRRAARAARRGVSPPRSTRTTTSRAARSALAEGRSASPALLDSSTMSGGDRQSRSRSAPRSTPTSTGSCSRMKASIEASRALAPAARHDDDHGSARDPGGRLGQAEPVEQQPLLTAQELGAVVGEGLELAAHPGPGLVHLPVHGVDVDLAAHRHRRAVGEHDLVVNSDRGAVGDPEGALDLVEDEDPCLGQHLRARGWGSAPRTWGRR